MDLLTRQGFRQGGFVEVQKVVGEKNMLVSVQCFIVFHKKYSPKLHMLYDM